MAFVLMGSGSVAANGVRRSDPRRLPRSHSLARFPQFPLEIPQRPVADADDLLVGDDAAHERELFERVTQARTQGMQATGVGDKAGAENQISAGLKSLFAVAEAYPELKANQNFLALQEELSATESKIAYARQFYNDQVMLLNTKIQSFPSSIIASMFRFKEHEFFDIDDAARGPIQVGF